MYLEQVAALLSEKYKNTRETKKIVKNTGKTLNIINEPTNKEIYKTPWRSLLKLQYQKISSV